MIKVTITDVVKQERKDDQGRSHEFHIILLQDEAGQRVLPIWVGPFEGQSIALGLSEFSYFRPLTFNFFASLLQVLNAQVEQVRIEMLKETTFYATVKIRRGKTACNHEHYKRCLDASFKIHATFASHHSYGKQFK